MSAEFIPLCIPSLRGNEERYVSDAITRGEVSSAVGDYLGQFEAGIATAAGAQHAVSTINGTAALHIALLLAGVRPGDEVITSTLTFIAPANAIRYVGAHPVFVDAEPDYWQLDPELVAAFLEQGCEHRNGAHFNKLTGCRVAALLPVHILGHPADMAALLPSAREFSLPVIEDATESLGAECSGGRVGSFGRLACFSFNGNKLITTGGGGMITTDDAALAERARHLTTQAKADPIEYIHDEIGYNYRLTNLQAAVGCAQVEKLDAYIEKKRAIAARYNEAFAGVPGFEPMREASWARSVFWMYTARFGPKSRDLLRALAAQKIQTRPLWQPLHRSAVHTGSQCLRSEIAESLFRECLSLPCSVGLTEDEQERVIAAVREWTDESSDRR